MLTIICAYCKRLLGHKEGGQGVTHSICTVCLEEQNKLLEEMVREQESENGQNKRN